MVVVAQRGSWGFAPAALVALLVLALGFGAHAAEKLAFDLWCQPYSLLQPTAALHACSAVTIGCGYVWLRSVEAAGRGEKLE